MVTTGDPNYLRNHHINPYELGTKLLTARNGHGRSGWSPIGCGFFHTNLNIPSPLLGEAKCSSGKCWQNLTGHGQLITKG